MLIATLPSVSVAQTPAPALASADGRAHIEYVAIGDSYPAGEGNSPYRFDDAFSHEFYGAGGIEPNDGCHRSLTNTYPFMLKGLLNNRSDIAVDSVVNFACTGATAKHVAGDEEADEQRKVGFRTENERTGYLHSNPPLPPPHSVYLPVQMFGITEQTDLVTVQVGINSIGAQFDKPELGVTDVVKGCLVWDCADGVSAFLPGLPDIDVMDFFRRAQDPARDKMGPLLKDAFDSIKLQLAPQAKVFVQGYPTFFATPDTQEACAAAEIPIRGSLVDGGTTVPISGKLGLSRSERNGINLALLSLNGRIAQSAAAAGFTYVDSSNFPNDELLCGRSANKALHPLSAAFPGGVFDLGTIRLNATAPPCNSDVLRVLAASLFGASRICQGVVYLRDTLGPKLAVINSAPMHPTPLGQSHIAAGLALKMSTGFKPAPVTRMDRPDLAKVESRCSDHSFILKLRRPAAGATKLQIFDYGFMIREIPVPMDNVAIPIQYGFLAGSHHLFSVVAVGPSGRSVQSNRQLASKHCPGPTPVPTPPVPPTTDPNTTICNSLRATKAQLPAGQTALIDAELSKYGCDIA